MKLHPSITVERVSAAVERQFSSLDNPGFCIACGEDADGCEPQFIWCKDHHAAAAAYRDYSGVSGCTVEVREIPTDGSLVIASKDGAKVVEWNHIPLWKVGV